MPITYGEGEENAQRRLQAEIEATGSAPSIISFSQNKYFVGRESQLAELKAKLFSNDQTTTMLAIVGPGGTGKSQLALEVAHMTRLNNKDCSVFWMDASDIESLSRSYASVAQKLSVPGCDNDPADIKQVVKRCVAAISARKCLLIYDNVEGTALRPSSSSTREAAVLADFLPLSKLCSIIFTTTESDTAEALVPQNVIALHELTPDTALRMLQNRLTTPLSDAEQQDAMHLLSELSYLPLAVVQAAACMNASYMTAQQYRAQLAEHKEAALEFSDDLPEGELRGSSLRDTVAATLSLSMSQVHRSNAVAADYLFLAACIDRKDILLDFLEATSLRTRKDAIKVLDQYALVTRQPAESALDVHRLVHCALRERLQADGKLQKWTRHTITRLLWVFPNDDHSNRSKWRRLLPHARYVLLHTQRDNDEERLDLAWKCAMALYSDGQYKAAEELQVEVMETSKRVLGDEHPDTLTSMHNLAYILWSQSLHIEAIAMIEMCFQMRRKVLGEQHPSTQLLLEILDSWRSDAGEEQ
jgi:DNA polymerase III delta prime subunit